MIRSLKAPLIQHTLGTMQFADLQQCHSPRDAGTIYTIRENHVRSIQINKNKLIEILKTNRTNHQVDYESDVRDFRKAARKALEAAIKKVKEVDAPITKKTLGSLNIALAAPQNFVKYYDDAISMLEMETRDTVELTVDEFRQYVKDEWNWRSITASNKLSYSNTMYASDAGYARTVTSEIGDDSAEEIG